MCLYLYQMMMIRRHNTCYGFEDPLLCCRSFIAIIREESRASAPPVSVAESMSFVASLSKLDQSQQSPPVVVVVTPFRGG